MTDGSLFESIWHDIDYEAEAIVVSDITYDPSSLSNSIYKIIDDRDARHKLLKNNKVKGLYRDLDKIRQHRNVIDNDPVVNLLVRQLFREEEIASITALDKVYINAYYRRLLRAQLEANYIDKQLTLGLVVTSYKNTEVDLAIVKTLRLLRLICKFLGITSTTQQSSIPIEKLNNFTFWSSISEKFVDLFGEARIELIPEESESKELTQMSVLVLLNVIFNTWSGTCLVMKDDKIEIIPATYVTQLLSKLKFIKSSDN